MKLARFVAPAAIAVLLLLAAVTGWLWYTIYVDRSHPLVAKQVVIDQGSTFAAVSQELVAAGVIGNGATFRVLARSRGQEGAVRAGEYRFGPHLTQSEVLACARHWGRSGCCLGYDSRRIHRRPNSGAPAKGRHRPVEVISARLYAAATRRRRGPHQRPRGLSLPKHLFGAARSLAATGRRCR